MTPLCLQSTVQAAVQAAVRASVQAASCIIVCVVLSGCADEKLVRTRRGVFDNMPGIQRGGADPLQPVSSDQARADPDEERKQIEVINPDGSITLRSPQMRHAVYHLRKQLLADDNKLLAEQVLAQLTRERFATNGKTLYDAADELRANRRDILLLLARLPNGENSPNALVTKQGPKLFRLAITGTAAKGLAFTELWIVLEAAEWKIVWVR